MVKSVLGVNHQGLRDWVIQRFSAVLMALYAIGMIGYFVLDSDVTFAEWHSLFSDTWMKVVTLLVLLSLMYHAWIGVWTVLTDYVKNVVVNYVLQAFVLLVLAACFLWAFLILWSV